MREDRYLRKGPHGRLTGYEDFISRMHRIRAIFGQQLSLSPSALWPQRQFWHEQPHSSSVFQFCRGLLSFRSVWPILLSERLQLRLCLRHSSFFCPWLFERSAHLRIQAIAQVPFEVIRFRPLLKLPGVVVLLIELRAYGAGVKCGTEHKSSGGFTIVRTDM